MVSNSGRQVMYYQVTSRALKERLFLSIVATILQCYKAGLYICYCCPIFIVSSRPSICILFQSIILIFESRDGDIKQHSSVVVDQLISNQLNKSCYYICLLVRHRSRPWGRCQENITKSLHTPSPLFQTAVLYGCCIDCYLR